MTGPLTPPPSSAIEIEDAARSSVSPAAPVAVVPQPDTPPPPPPATQMTPITAAPAAPAVQIQMQTSYKGHFPAIAQLAESGSFEELIRLTEDADLNVVDGAHTDRLLVLTPLVLTYLILDDLPPAQHALLRVPEALRSHLIFQSLFKLLASTIERKYERVYSRADHLRSVIQMSEFPDADLKAVAGILLDKFIDSFRRKTFTLLSRAYTSIPLPLAQTYLGLPEQQVISTAAEYKWSYDPSSRVISPIPTDAVSNATYIGGRMTGQSTLTTFNLIANVGLE